MFCLANCCRFCLTKDSTVVEYTSSSVGENVSYLNKLMDIAPQLLVNTDTYYPTGICKKCQDQLDQAHSFIQQCIKSKKILQTYINKLNQATNISIVASDSSTNIIRAEEPIFTEIPISSSQSNAVFIENKPIKVEIDVEDTIGLSEFASNDVDTISHNPLLHTTESLSLDTYVKQEVFDSEFISDRDLQETQFLFAAVKNEPSEVISDETNSTSYLKEENQAYIEENYTQSDASTSDEFEPIRKNEKTPRLKRYKCFKCAKKFSRYSHLMRHSRVHTGNRPYPCPTCNKSFSQLENLERHQLIHSDIKPYTCAECNKSFRDKSYFKKHVQLHEGIRYTCDVCGKAYTNSRNLIVHKRIHTGERPFECSLCKTKYADPDTLRRHKKKCETKWSCRQDNLQNQEDGASIQVAK